MICGRVGVTQGRGVPSRPDRRQRDRLPQLSHTPELSHRSHLELIHAIPRPCLCDELPEDDAEAENVTLGGHAAQLGVEAFGSPERKWERMRGRCQMENRTRTHTWQAHSSESMVTHM